MPSQDDAKTRAPRWWVETTNVRGCPHRKSGEYAVGSALISPRRDKGGKDIYSGMRQVRDGDICLHLTDRTAITGISHIAGAHEEFRPSQAGLDLEGVRIPSDEGYRVWLRGYRRLDPALDHSAIIGREFRERLLNICKTDRVYYDRNLQLKQQGYLNPAPAELVDVLDEAYRKVSGKTLREIVKEDDAQPPSPRWDTFIEWAKRFYEWEQFNEAGAGIQAQDRGESQGGEGRPARRQPRLGRQAEESLRFAQQPHYLAVCTIHFWVSLTPSPEGASRGPPSTVAPGSRCHSARTRPRVR